MAKIEMNVLSENGKFQNVNKLIELLKKAEQGKALKVEDYNLLTVIGVEKLLTYDDIERLMNNLALLEGTTVSKRDLIQTAKVIENLQITLVQTKTDGTKELLDMRWDYRGINHNSVKEALKASGDAIKEHVNQLYEETQNETLKEISGHIADINKALATEFSKILIDSSDVDYEIDRLKKQNEIQETRIESIEQINKDQDVLIKSILSEKEKNNAYVTETNVIDYTIEGSKVRSGQLEINNITGNTLKNISKTERPVNILYGLKDFENNNEFEINNENDIMIELKEIQGRTLFNYNNEKDIIPKIKYDDIIGNTEYLKNKESGYMQLESIEGNTLTNQATIKDSTIISHKFDDLCGNNNEIPDLKDGTILIEKITGNTMTNISKSKEEFQVTHSFDKIVDGVKLDLVNSEDDSCLRIGIVEGKTLENMITEEPRFMILNNKIEESFITSISIPNTTEGGELDLIIEGHTASNLSKTKDITPVTYKFDDIIGNEGLLDSASGMLEIDRIKGNTLINKVISEHLTEINLKESICLEPNSIYQILFNIDKDCNDYTFSIGNSNQLFYHPLIVGQNEITIYTKEEEYKGNIFFESNNDAVISDVKIFKGGQETLILNDRINIKNTHNAYISNTVEAGRIDIDLLGNTIINLSKMKDEAIVVSSSGDSFVGNEYEVTSESETIEIASIKGLTYRNMLNKLADLTFTEKGNKHNFSMIKEVAPNSEYTIVCTASSSFTITIDETDYTVDNGTVITTPEVINDYTLTVTSTNKGQTINNLMLLEGRVTVISDEAFLGVMSTFESEVVQENDVDMYQIEITTSHNDEELSSEVYLLSEPLRSVFEYNDEIVYDDKTQELIVNRVAAQIGGSVIDRNVLRSSQAGIYIDFTGSEIQYERKEDAIGRVPGRDFNHIMPWAGMRKVAIDTAGNKTYYNEEGYTENGTVGSIFIEIPKFYYLVNAIDTESYYNNIMSAVTERNLINWKLSYKSGTLESTSSTIHKSTGYLNYDKTKPIELVYDNEMFSAEIIYFNTSSSASYPSFELAPETGKFRICFKKLDETAFTTDDVLYLIDTSRVDEYRGQHINKGEWFVSSTLEPGYTVHPAFIRNGEEVDYIYVAAYESSAYRVKDNSFIMNDSDVDVDNDYLVSIKNALPVTGLGKLMTLLNTRRCANRANAHLFDLTSLSAVQLLFLIEYASFDSQAIVGNGIVDLTESLSTSYSNKTGMTSDLIDRTGSNYAVSYRGIENLWGNVWTMIDGVNLYNDIMTTMYWSNDELGLSISEGYTKINMSSPNYQGGIRRFGYDKNNPFAFIPSEVNEDNYINETYEQKQSSGWRILLSGGAWSANSSAGLFSSKQDSSTATTNLTIGSRLLYY